MPKTIDRIGPGAVDRAIPVRSLSPQAIKRLAQRPFSPLVPTVPAIGAKPPRGWTGRAWVNNRYIVQEQFRDKTDGSGRVLVLAICCIDPNKTARQFDDLMLIKDQCWGPEANAVEVYPPRSLLVDQANMTWLWRIEPLPFGLHRSQKPLSTAADKGCGQPAVGTANT